MEVVLKRTNITHEIRCDWCGCDSTTATCTCNKGWQGIGCEYADCPGDPDCSNNGTCIDSNDPPTCLCYNSWFGEACEEPCVHGQMNPVGSQNCECDPGWVGINCDVECSYHGTIVNAACDCDVGWRGRVCDIPSCPGNLTDCSGNGDCNAATHECTCYSGWTGQANGNGYVDPLLNGCDVPDCPGTPDCNGEGVCDNTLTTPKCKACNPGWMGEACEDICDAVHGVQSPMNSGFCECDSCYTGKGCDNECDGHGMCSNGTCNCTVGWRGSKCEVPGCPGNGSDCTNHGVCNSALHECTCIPGWTGDDCNTPDCGYGACYVNESRGLCDGSSGVPECICNTADGWFGLDCDKKCENGTVVPNNLGGECVCFDCYNGDRCQLECSDNGICDNGTCNCYRQPKNAWVGSLCETEGCPGADGRCDGHGTCINMECICFPGWQGYNCSLPECPNDCNGVGDCEYDPILEAGVCQCFPDWIGDDCSIPCINGTNLGDGVCSCYRTCDTGLSCHLTCEGNGVCDNNGSCICDFNMGYKGDICDIDGCPGWPDNCMNHGTCNAASGECTCDQGWKGNACHIPDCDCNGINATCEQRTGDLKPRCYDCDSPYIGDQCQYRCEYGVEDPATFECICDPCYSGAECDSLCNNQGNCTTNGTCDCGFDGYRGDFCQTKECPGYDVSCTGHGQCNPATGVCSCSTGWVGIGCHIVKCDNDCSNAGTCLELAVPECNCSAGYFGADCGSFCYNGDIITPDLTDLSSQYCECHSCYTGFECGTECSGRGSCNNGTCDCGTAGWRGDNCEKVGCPGLYGTDCSGHGSCITGAANSIGTCTCNTYWVGYGCWTAECLNNCSGNGICNDSAAVPFCTQCDQGWMGPDCSEPCYGIQQPMDSGICVCTSNCENQADNCQLSCSGYGTCDIATDSCVCHDGTGYNPTGYWGTLCETKGCPGIDESCSGHGQCIQGSCKCDPGWTINATSCHVPDCPGTPDCNGNGACDTSGVVPVCTCYQGWMGNECQYPCINGAAQTDQTCLCDPCYTGAACDQICNGLGSCVNDTCSCDSGYWGTECDVRGCPGNGESCSGNGICTVASQTCTCDVGWTDIGCDTWDCPGTPDCNGKGSCDGANYWPPKCVNCTDSMGSECQYDCVHGAEFPQFSSICVCDPCYDDFACNVECNEVGTCVSANTTNSCDCETGYKGDFCEELDCPGDPDCSTYGQCIRDTATNSSICVCDAGFTGADCSEFVCPGAVNDTCNGNGDCLLLPGYSAPQCVCYHGFNGLACDSCVTNFVGTNCEECREDYIGYNTTCDTFCANGYATVLGGDVCECFDDDVNGHWINPQTGCVDCLLGWNKPHCTECAANYVGPDCDISCADYQGYFVDIDDGTNISSPIVPIFQCLELLGPDSYQAWFGYSNPNPNNVYITATSENAMYADGVASSTYTPPTKFINGIVAYATVIGPANLTVITEFYWTVVTLSLATEMTAEIDASALCSSPPQLTTLPVVQGMCSCNHGYYGSACWDECPGGGSNPCYGKGKCDTVTGACTCIEGADQSTDCATCISGWYGDDCKFAGTNRQNSTSDWYTGMLYGYGHCQTFDGSKYDTNEVGQYLLSSVTVSTGQQLKIHALRVTGSNQVPVVTTNAIGLSIGGNTLVIQSDGVNPEGSQFLNDQSTTVGNELQLATEVTIVQTTPSQYVLTASTDFFITIDMKDGFIDTYISAKASVCGTGLGLIGACDSSPNNDFVTSSGNTLLEGDPSYPLTVATIADVFVPSWKSDDSVFTNLIPDYDNGAGETCLHIINSPMESIQVTYFTKSEITVDLIFYLESVTGDCATLWSYKNPSGVVFSSLVCDGYISFSIFNSSEDRTTINNLPVQLSTWYKLSVVWTSSDETLYFYLIEDNLSFINAFATASNVLDAFTPGGTFMLGMTHEFLVHPFDGYIDDFTVWKSSFTLNEIVARAFEYINVADQTQLSYIWRFNEGNGYKSEDSTTNSITLSWESGNWANIHWSVCAYTMTYPDEDIKDILISDPPPEHEEKCKNITDSISYLNGLGEAAKSLYYDECLLNLAVTNDTDSGDDILTPITDTVEPNRTDPNYPTKDLCNDYPDQSNWYGKFCNVYCVQGAGVYDINDDKCYCNHGYFGYGCANQCPYARGEPCGGGSCDKDNGDCTCTSEKFDPSTGCQTCASGWIGTDCSSVSAVIPNSLSRYSAMCFGQGHCNMFDGQAFNMKEPGEYQLFKKTSENLSVFVRVRPCSSCKSSIQQVWFQMNSDDFTVKVPLNENEPVILEHDGSPVTILSLSTYTINSDASISWVDKVTLQFVIGPVTIDISYLENSAYLSVNVETTCTSGDQTGLLGNCNQNLDDDFVDINGNAVAYADISNTVVDDEFLQFYARDPSLSTAFVYSYPGLSINEPQTMSQGYSLMFNGTGAMSGRVPTDAFFENKPFNVSIEVKMKFLVDGGLVLGYYKADSDNDFSLYLNNSKLLIHLYDTVYDTNTTLAIGQWYHIILTFDVTSNKMDLFVYTGGVVFLSKQFTNTNVTFPPSGNFLLGDWEVAPPLDFGIFHGLIGEVRIWNIFLDSQKIYQLNTNPDITGVVGLVMHFRFPEGYGYVTYDSYQNIGMTIAESGDTSWIICDKPGQTIDSFECSGSNDPTRVTECEDIFKTNSVTSACDGLGTDFSTFYIDACKNDDSYVPALVSYITMCETIINPTSDPIDDLCSDHKADHYDSFCGHFCMQGTPTSQGCICNIGFWSWNCAQECPDRTGPDNLPCFKQGSCDVDTGDCICYPGFDPSVNCQTCVPPFTGDNCDEANLTLPVPPTSVTTVSPSTSVSLSTTSPGANSTSGGGGGTSGTTSSPTGGNSSTVSTTSSGSSSGGGGSGGNSSTVSTTSSGSSSGGTTANPGNIIEYKTCQLFGMLRIKTFTDELFSIATTNEWYLLDPVGADAPAVKVQSIKCGTSICLKSMQISYLTESILVDGTLSKAERVKLNGGSDLRSMKYFILSEKSDNAISFVSVDGQVNRFVRVEVSFDDRGYMNVLLKIDCLACTNYTLCNPKTNFIQTYDPIDPSTFTDIVVPPQNETLDDTVIEPNTTAYYSLKFGSNSESNDGSGSSGSNSSSSGTSGTTGTNTGGGLGYNKPIVCTSTGDTSSVISTNVLRDTLDQNEKTTVKMSLKPDNGSSGGIFQYVGDSTFVVFLDNGRVKVQADSQIIDTNIDLPQDLWSDIEMFTDPVTETMNLKVTSPDLSSGTPGGVSGTDTTTLTSIFTTPSVCFADNGRVVIGKPILSMDDTLGVPTDGSFTGELEDVQVYSGDNDDPVLNLQFDDGKGSTVTDKSTGGHNLTIFDPYGLGTTTFGVSSISASEIVTDTTTGFSDLDSYNIAIDTCTQLFNNTYINSECSGFSLATKYVYQSSCMDQIARTNDLHSGVDALQSYTTLCYNQLIENINDNSTQTPLMDPIRYLCIDDKEKAGFVGANCDIRCVHPEPQSDGLSCECTKGYWGTACENECPGGASSPCSGHGVCNSDTGVCSCSINYKGNNCSVCADGFIGADCQVALQDTSFSSNKYTTFITGNSYMKTLDGAYVQFNNKDQPFELYNDGTVKIEAQKGPTDLYPSSIKAVAFSVGGQNVTIHPQDSGTVMLDGVFVSLGIIDLPSGYNVIKSSSTEFVISGPDNFEMRVPLADDGMGVSLTVPKSSCRSSTGVLGKCSAGDANNCNPLDINCIIGEVGVAEACSSYEITSQDLDDFFADSGKSYDDTVFANSGETEITSGTGLKIADGGYISLPPIDDSVISPDSNVKSIEMRLKVDTADDGTIFSVANDNTTFGVVIKNEKYFLQYGNQTYATNTPVTLNEWTNIGISMNDTSGEVLFHEIHETGYKYKFINMSNEISQFGSPISDGSTAMIGKWQNLTTIDPSSGPGDSQTPVIAVDRLLVYDDHLTLNDFTDHYEKNIDNSTFTTGSSSSPSGPSSSNLTSGSLGGLSINSTSNGTVTYSDDSEIKPTMGFNFDEGAGNTAKDFISGKDAVVGFNGDYQWPPSDPPITTKGVPDQSSIDIIPDVLDNDKVNDTCSQVKEVMKTSCNSLSGLIDMTFMSCLNDGIDSNNVDNSMVSARAYATECMKQNNLPNLPTDSLCNLFGNRDYPIIGGQNCTQNCNFGKFVSDECTCDHGYWGTECENECPGGHLTPCNNHGTCDLISGECFCEQNWGGDTECSSCSQYFSGNDCDLFNTNPNVGTITSPNPFSTTTIMSSSTTGPVSTGTPSTATGAVTNGTGNATTNTVTGTPVTGATGTTGTVTTGINGTVTGGNGTTPSGSNSTSGSGSGGGSTTVTTPGTTVTSTPGIDTPIYCTATGKDGTFTMFNTKQKKLDKAFDKGVLLEFHKLRVSIRQSMKKKKKKKSFNIDKVFITYRKYYVNFEFSKLTTSKSKKAKSTILVDGIEWKKETKIDRTIGDMWLTNKDTSTITVTILPLNLYIEVTRGSSYFGIDIKLMSSLWDTKGLCKWVPSDVSDLVTHDYERYTSVTPIPGYTGTTCKSDMDFSNMNYFDNTNTTNKVSGYALCCNSASASYKGFKLFASKTTEVTIMFYLKTCTGCHGVIFSYSTKVPFSLDYNDGTVVIWYGQKSKWDSEIELKDNEWYQIVVTWSKSLKRMVLYVFNENSGNKAQVFTINQFKASPFSNGGSLSLGKFQISQTIPKWKKDDSFVGCYDSLGFATQALDATTIASLYSKPIDKVKEYLSNSEIRFFYYDFDEDTSYTNGNVEIDLDEDERISEFGKKAKTYIKFDNTPLRSCAQRPSDSPQYDSSSSGQKSRRRRSLDEVSEISDLPLQDNTVNRPKRNSHVLGHKVLQHVYRPKRSISYSYSTFCQNVFQSTSSSLANNCSSASLLPKMSVAMWDCIDADGDEEDMAYAISQFANECERTLSLSFWPAEQTCLEFENDFNLYTYMGTKCWPECPFGLRESSTSACECDDGFWNATCTAVCPGGALTPCSGYGTCDSVTGECDCPINRLPAVDCSVCSEGWYGSNCEIAVNNVNNSDNNSFAVLGQLGVIYSFDGLAYSVKTQGELLLMAISENIIIQGKFITCYQNYSCVPFIAARIGDAVNGYATVTVQAERKYDSKPMVFINDVSDTLDSPAYFNGFKVYRSNFFQVTFEIKDLVTFYIRNEGQYLHMTMELTNMLTTQTSGLLSGGLYTNITDRLDHLYSAEIPDFGICNDTSSIQSVLGSESTNTISLTAYTQSYGNTSDLDVSRFIVSDCDSIIYFTNDLLKYQTQGGYGLNFSKSSIQRELTLDTSATTSLTIEVLVKQNEANNSGVLFSYTSSSSSSLLLVSGESSLEVHVYVGSNITVYDTAVTLDEDFWNKVVFVYDNTDGTSTVYVIDKDSTISTTGDFTINSALFEDTGTLTIGHWNIPFDSTQYYLPNGFAGSIENFMIWNLTIEESQVGELWQMDPAVASGSLLFALQFDEGDGTLTNDNIGNLEVSLPEYPWKAPEWIISDLDYSSSYVSDFALTFFNNDTWESEANTFCLSTIAETDSISLSNSTRNFFFLNCLQNLAVTRYKTSGYNAILDALTLGVSQHGETDSKIDTFCSTISDTDKNGTSCNTTCAFGFEHPNGTCSCFEGYYGTSCDGICPGSSYSPCNYHGECLTDGTCDCWWNWNGNLDCSTCTTDSSGDMVGPDCSILSTTSLSSSSLKVAAVSSNGNYMTFDGQQISFIGETGAFMLFSSSLMGVDIHVYQVSCHYGSCVAAVSLTSSTDDFVIAAPGQGISPILYRNGNQIILDDITNVLSASMTVTQESLTDISVTITGIGSITVKILVQEQFLQASVISSSTICQAGSGIFDKCNGNGKDYSSMSTSEISEYILTNYRLSSSIILDALNAPVGDGSNITGYALKFDKTAGISVPLSYPDDFNISLIDFSLSLYFKPLALGGYIMSYGKNTTFAILNSNPITLQCDTNFVESTVSPELDVWNQLILTFRRNERTVDLFHFGTDSKLTQEVLNFECGSVFERDGTVMLGEYMPSVGSSPYTFGSQYFTGMIDEFSVWKNPIPNSLIYQAHLLSTKISGFSTELATLVSFSEGVGAVAYEEINGNNMVLPSAPWQSPKWIVSDLGLQPLRTYISEIYTTTNIDAVVETMCGNFFDSGTVASNCVGVTDFIRWWYKQTCMITATNTGNITDTAMAMADFTSICGVTGGNVDNIYDVLCALNISKPAWLARKCSDCDFGYKTDTECVCYYGYYGTSCDGVCPGGASNPCNGHGECDKGGNCQCSGRWTDTACDTCVSGWFGDDCSIYTSSFDPLGDNATTLVAQVNMIGQLSTFDGTILDMPQRGYFDLMAISSLDILLEGRFGVCNSEDVFHVCLIGFVLEHDDESYYVSYERFTGSSVEIMSSTSSNITIFDELKLGNMTLKLDSPTTLKMTMRDSDLTVKMSSISDRLLSTMSIPMTEWTSQQSEITGILSSCNTEKAITAANCSVSRQSLCIDPSQTIPSNCKLNQTTETFSQYLNNSAYNNTNFMEMIEIRYLSAMESNCFKYEGNGVSAAGISLPDSDFTVEMHAKPTNHGGILLTYDDGSGKYITLINHADGMIVALDGVYHLTGLPLELDVWNQISLAWRDDAKILEVYLTNDTGVAVVKAIPIDDVFNSGGTLTLGQLTPDIGVSISMGDYTGYIDEVRIWDRPHNPTVITNNFRKMITDDTSDVWHSWTFNEGIGLTAYEDKQGNNMVPVNIITPPVWTKSSLDLSEDKDLDAPRLTTEDELSAATLLEAQQMCDNLISNFSLSIVGSSMDVLTDVYEALCVQELTSTGDQAQADAVLASAADLYISLSNSSTNPLETLCNVMSSVSSYIGASGGSCTACVFGTVSNDTCVCFDTHWGQTCDSICPIGPLGACNTFGVCDSTLGVCNCHPRHYSGSATVSNFWQSYVTSSDMNMTANYTCDSCSENWYGKECEFSKASPKSSSSYYGIIYGSYVTNFEGVSYTHVTPGVYSLLKTSSIEVQALFVPCTGDNRCRHMKEFALQKGSSNVMIQHAEETGQNVTVRVDGVDVSYPYKKAGGSVTLEWTEDPYIKVSVGSSSFVVFDSDMGLVTTATISASDAKKNSGLLGKPDGDWSKDFKCENDTGILDKDDLTTSYAGVCIREQFATASGQIFINHTDADDFISSGGFALSLSTGEGFTVNGFTVEQGLTKFTSSYWVKSSKHSKKRTTLTHPLLTIDAGGQDIVFRVDSSFLVVDWDTTYTTTLIIDIDTWYYIAFSWNDDGSAVIYVISDNNVQDYTISGMNVGGTVDVNEITMTATSSARVTFDCLRAWTETKTLSDAITDMDNYCDSASSGTSMMLSLTFDEGNGTTSSLTTYSTNDGTNSGSISGTVTGTISGLSNASTPWIPSSIPIPDIPTATTLTAYGRSTTNNALINYTDAAAACLEVIKNDTISKTCKSLSSSTVDHFLEACIRDYQRIGEREAQRILESTLIYYCATAMGVDECKFSGYYYFCTDVEEEEEAAGLPLIIIAAAGGGALLLIGLIILIVCLKKKKQKEKERAAAAEDDPSLSLVSNTKFNTTALRRNTTETSFVSMDSRRQSAWDDSGRNSVVSVNSPIMFSDDEPNSPTPSTSGSFFKKGTVSPMTVAPLTEQKKIAVNNWSKLMQKAAENGATSPHPAPNPVQAPKKNATPAKRYIATSPEPGATSAPTSPVSPAPVANWGKLLEKALNSGATSPQFNGIPGSEPSTPMPAFAPNAPKGMFGQSPQPMFGSNTSAGTPKPSFAPDAPSSLGGSNVKQWKKPASIPRVPQNGRNPSSSSAPDSVVDDLDTA